MTDESKHSLSCSSMIQHVNIARLTIRRPLSQMAFSCQGISGLSNLGSQSVFKSLVSVSSIWYQGSPEAYFFACHSIGAFIADCSAYEFDSIFRCTGQESWPRDSLKVLKSHFAPIGIPLRRLQNLQLVSPSNSDTYLQAMIVQ